MRPRACADACEVPLRRPQTENRTDSTFGFSVEFGVRAESKKHGRGRRSPNGVQIGLSSLLFLAIMSVMIREMAWLSRSIASSILPSAPFLGSGNIFHEAT